jgi:hypothetical protein
MECSGARADDPDLISLQNRKIRQEKVVAKLKAEAPSVTLRKLALLEAQDKFLKEAQTQREIAERGKLKALNRAEERLKNITTLEEYVVELRGEATDKFTEAKIAHDKRAAEKATLVAGVDALLCEKLRELRVVDEMDIQGDGDFEDTISEPDLDTLAAAEMINSMKHQREAKETAAAMMEQIASLQAKLDEQIKKETVEAERAELAKREQEELQAQNTAAAQKLAAATAAATAASADAQAAAATAAAAASAAVAATAQEFEEIAPDADFDALPEIDIEHLKKANPAALLATGDLFFVLSKWRNAGAAVPFTFQDLIEHTVAALESPKLVRELLADQWSHWFEEDVHGSKILPRQAVLALLATLDRARDQYDGSEENRVNATNGYKKLAEAAKKRKLA